VVEDALRLERQHKAWAVVFDGIESIVFASKRSRARFAVVREVCDGMCYPVRSALRGTRVRRAPEFDSIAHLVKDGHALTREAAERIATGGMP
jgi:hypothetical protein